jgi:hypothetical protein
MLTRPSKKHHNKIIAIRSLTWKEKGEEFGKVLIGTYTHLDNAATFGFYCNGKSNTFQRNEWEVIDIKVAVWIQEVYTWQQTEHQLPEYRQGYVFGLKSVIKHMLMD